MKLQRQLHWLNQINLKASHSTNPASDRQERLATRDGTTTKLTRRESGVRNERNGSGRMKRLVVWMSLAFYRLNLQPDKPELLIQNSR